MTYQINTPSEKNVTYTLDGVDYVISPRSINNVLTMVTEEEALKMATNRKEWNDASATRKLAIVRNIREDKLKTTDWMGNNDYTMPDNIKTWRQSLRDIPQDYTTEEEYDLLLAKNEDKESLTYGSLTHAIWSKP
tara:strand:+ start:314 stop:718 length:405 start_codon:yes stop_codon:yes gene_type:complete